MLVGVTSSQRKIMSQNILKEDGEVVPVSASLFGPTAFPIGTTHILVDQRSFSYEALCAAANCISIPKEIPVLHNTWVINCCYQQALQDTASFVVPTTNSATPPAITDSTVNSIDITLASSSRTSDLRLTTTGTKHSIVEEESSLHLAKRLKECEDAIGAWNTVSIDSLREKQTGCIIPDSIQYEDYSFDSWHEYDGIMFKFQAPHIPSETIERMRQICEDPAATTVSTLLPVVAFDLDHNIITTKSGNVYAKTHADWQLWHSDVPKVLRDLSNGVSSDGGFTLPVQILIVSNQGGLKKSDANEMKKKQEFRQKIDSIAKSLGVPVSFICSSEYATVFRKPLPGMWQFYQQFMQHHQSKYLPIPTGPTTLRVDHHSQGSNSTCLTTSTSNVTPNMQLLVRMLLYVGDAAGRPAAGIRKKDFSDSDLKFAVNVGAQFQTPEVFFLRSNQKLHRDIECAGIRLSDLPVNTDPLSLILSRAPTAPGTREIILMIGPPATGKSSIAKRLEHEGYGRVNQDTLKTIQKCLQVAKRYLTGDDDRAVRGIVVDNTNLDAKVRKLWINLAKEVGVVIRAVCMDISQDVATSLEKLRTIDPSTASEERHPIPSFVMGKFFKERVWPEIHEGFEDIQFVPFSMQPPSSAITAELHRYYLTN